MSRHRVLTVLTAAVVLLPGLAHAGSSAPAGRVSVVYEHPEKFTDVKDTAAGLARGRDAYLAALAVWLERRAALRVPPDHTLSIAITEVDRAGDFEPARGPSFASVRIVRDLYAPRITLRFALTDRAGTVVRGGERTLVDPLFLTRTSLDQQDPLRHEPALLDAWLDREFPRTP
jgi:DUF3016 family protein